MPFNPVAPSKIIMNLNVIFANFLISVIEIPQKTKRIMKLKILKPWKAKGH